MKTYNIICAFLVLMAIGCSKTDEVLDGGEEELAKTNYHLLLNANGTISSHALHADANAITHDAGVDPFDTKPLPQLTYRNGLVLGLYHKETDCSGKITLHDFTDGTTTTVAAFADIASCDLTATGLAHTGSTLFVSYMIEVDSKNRTFFVRAIDLHTEDHTFIDIELDWKPIQLVFANNRLFVLTIDEKITGDNGLTVIDVATNTIINEMELGLDARQLFVDTESDIVIGYDDLHTVLNSKTMKLVYTNYETGKEPKFATSSSNYFDGNGNLYYERDTEDLIRPNIPAIYDFGERTVYLYSYENFLTQTELQFEYEIGNTTVVSYDAKNNLLLIGYQKIGTGNKGGLLRLKPAPEPKLVDNTHFDGVPFAIYVEE